LGIVAYAKDLAKQVAQKSPWRLQAFSLFLSFRLKRKEEMCIFFPLFLDKKWSKPRVAEALAEAQIKAW